MTPLLDGQPMKLGMSSLGPITPEDIRAFAKRCVIVDVRSSHEGEPSDWRMGFLSGYLELAVHAQCITHEERQYAIEAYRRCDGVVPAWAKE
jgi:hypothetical protein